MNYPRRTAAALMALALVASAAVAPAVATQQETAESYAGTHVSFETTGSTVADYTVDGAVLLDSVSVESASNYEQRTGATVRLSGDVDVRGAGLSVASTTRTSATVRSESGATMAAHDNGHGILVVDSGGESQVVQANLSADASAESESDGRVVVERGDGSTGTFIVVGEGSVDVDDEGDVVASVGAEGKLVFRAYPDGERDSGDETNERLIANGSAMGEVYATTEDGGDVVVDTVTYGEDASIEAAQSAENRVEVTVDSASEQGKVVITEVSEQAVGSVDDLSVQVDGEAAVEAESHSELVAATKGGDTSKYVVRQRSEASATAEVLVGVNHFSERTITMSGDETAAGTGTSSGSNGDTDTSTPGFGVGVAVLALLAAAVLVGRR